MPTNFATCAALGFGLLGARAAAADCRDPFGKPNEVLEFHVRVPRNDWDLLRAFELPYGDCKATYPEYRAEFRCGDAEPWIKVALQRKRGGDSPPQKPPLKIQFNEDFMGAVPEAKGQSWPAAMGALGYRRLSLNNGQSNPPASTYGPFLLPVLLKEYVGLRLLGRELALSPGVAFAKLFLHFDDDAEPEYHGVFILIEDIDRAAISRRVGPAHSGGRLIKETKASCAAGVQFDDGAPNLSTDAFDAWMRKNPGAYPGRWMNEVERAIDLDWLLRQEAIREILVNGDDTILNNVNNEGANPLLGNNYFAFDPRSDGRRLYVPWDVDAAFGHLYTMCGEAHYKCVPTTPLLGQCAAPVDPRQSLLGQRTVCQPDVRRRYLETMCQLINGSLSAEAILKVWDESDQSVRPVIPLERALVWEGRDPLDPRNDLGYGEEYARIRSWIPRRIASVRQQLGTYGIACPDRCADGAEEACHLLGCQGSRRCESGGWQPCDLPAACAKFAAFVESTDAGSGPEGGPDGEVGGVSSLAADGGAIAPDQDRITGCHYASGQRLPPWAAASCLLVSCLLAGCGRRGRR